MVYTSYLDVGILRDVLLSNAGFQLSFVVPAYLIGRATNYMEAKDLVWGIGQSASVWWAAIGRHMIAGVPIATILKSLTRSGWLLLTGATLWGVRLSYRVASRALKRGKDDSRYEQLKNESSGWTKSLFSMYLPEAIAQAIITLPLTVPFRASLPTITPIRGIENYLHAFAIFLYTSGYAIEALADYQLSVNQESKNPNLLTEGVWSIVRHPNYLGDILIHASFPILLYANGLFSPITLLGPIANWFFLRFISGDKENEANQAARYEKNNPEKKEEFDAFRAEKNSVWPDLREVKNKWTWIVLAIGSSGVLTEAVVSSLL
ncbi:uncharacterized protein IL334_002193 [Kwoniella shivajii]|uniref:DUF1295-domain-containing protein n=1 Tax=Kwoniella shivajii TaxID=564305 RepID=A0ABZ1CUC4_9TREE|nr:hypothetical protein IL334_002193 [Kwoniella shivajii]